jgi:hypothetical protein
MMNYAYSLLEAEASLAARALGLDAAMGIVHVDQPNRDSLACELMEPVRPQVDAYLVDWITTQPLTEKISETAPTWRRAVAPVAEWVAQALWSSAERQEARHLPCRRALHNAADAKAGRTRSRWGKIHYLAEEKFARCAAQRESKPGIVAFARSKHQGKTWRGSRCSATGPTKYW